MGRWMWVFLAGSLAAALVAPRPSGAAPRALEDDDLPEGDADLFEEELLEVEAGAPPAALPVAAPRGVLVLVLEEGGPLTTEGITLGEEAARILGRRAHLEPLSPRRWLTDEAQRGEEIADAAAAVERGMEAVGALDLDEAGAQLELGVNVLLAHHAALDARGREALGRGLFALAATTLFEGQSAQADGIFVALALSLPEFVPEATRFPSSVPTRFAAVKRELDERAEGALEVKTAPPGAQVAVDGRPRGTAPLEIPNLADGYHAVTVYRPGYLPFGTIAPVSGGRSSTLDVELELDPAAAPLAALAPRLASDPRGALALAGELGVARVAMLRVAPRGADRWMEGLWLDGEGRQVLGRIAEQRLPASLELAAQVVADALLASEAGELLAEAPAAPASPPVTERWWFWAAVGGLAVVAASSAAVVLASSGGDPGPPSRSGVVLGF